MKLSEKVDLEKAEKLIAELDAHPATQIFREDKAAELLAKRRETAGRIAALRNEQVAAIPKLMDAVEATEAKYAAAKAAQESAAEEVRAAAAALRAERLVSDTTIRNCEAALLESASPEIDAAIKFFRDKLDFLRTPGRISRNAIGSETNLISWKKKTLEESNAQAVRDAMRYCQAAIPELENMKLAPAVDAERIAALKTAVPQIDVYAPHTGERPMEKVNTDPRSMLPSDSQMEWQIGKLLEKVKQVMAPKPAPAKRAEAGTREAPAIPAPAPKPAKQATLEMYQRQDRAGYLGGAFKYGDGSKR